MIASNAGSDGVPAWWLNLQAAVLWSEFARLNPGCDEYRKLTKRSVPVVLLKPVFADGARLPHRVGRLFAQLVEPVHDGKHLFGL